ncbi:lysine exporter LysO family protein [Fervidobacterium thailandense]|uniref:Lysine exporter LysO family protein n=1 Tax=Fervidobacterium thailandense TaxID=1008305 RepID=A0A1E3G0Y7_9BACT|nr:lysine exporter LysO family protein [Fervidobacterium thailandense]ODN29914.1 hypothetical protein A4H02_08265 [Fervidobacterium thailandense]
MQAVILLSAVVLGLVFGRIFRFTLPDWSTEVILYALVFAVGLDLSKERIERRFLKNITIAVFSTLFGTLSFVLLSSLFLPLKKLEILAAASGFGWYSLSAILITSSYSAYLGSISFFSNVLRELLGIVLVPFGMKVSKLGTISVAGATSMDTLLGLVASYSDRETALISFGHGFIVSMLVPVMVNFFLGLLK